jgi:probable rRNA maturation factor
MRSLVVNIIDEQNLLIRFSRNKQHKRKIISALKSICRRILCDADICFGGINVVIVGGAEIRVYNAGFLGHDYVTDVISFLVDYKECGSNNGNVKKYLEGDILVCADAAIERADEFGWSPLEELFLYAIHGVLHLAGYDDKKITAKKRMQKKESEYINIIKNNFK